VYTYAGLELGLLRLIRLLVVLRVSALIDVGSLFKDSQTVNEL